ncbi:MAG: ABC transporter substrate-binding protein [Actinomycetota bacterium]
MRLNRARLLLAVLMSLLLVAAACGGDDSEEETGDATSTTAGDDGDSEGEAKGSVVVGSTNFSEQQILAHMYAIVLEDAGYDVETKLNLGSREVVEPALEAGEIDVYPEYAATLLEFLNKGAGEASGDVDETVEILGPLAEEKGFTVLEPSEAQDQNALVVLPETAEEHGLETISDLEPVAGELVFGGPPECPERPFCLLGLEETYGLSFEEFKPLDAGGPLTREALENGTIDVGLFFSSFIPDPEWVVLEDDKGLQRSDNLIPAVRTEVLDDEIEELLNAVSAALDTDKLTELNLQVDQDREDPADVARAFLEEEGLIEGG